MSREEVERSLYFILKVVVSETVGNALVVAVVAEEVEMEEEAELDKEVVAAGQRNPILSPDYTLTRNGRFLAMMRKARYFLSAINMNRARSMWLIYWNLPLIRSPRLRPDRNLIW